MLFEGFEHIVEGLANWAILAFEFVGIIILIISGLKGVKDYITDNPSIRLNLAEGMALSLEFKLGSEILRTVLVRQIDELFFIAGIIILRASLTFLIHWEINYEEKSRENKKIENKNLEAIEINDQKLEKDLMDKILDLRYSHLKNKK